MEESSRVPYLHGHLIESGQGMNDASRKLVLLPKAIQDSGKARLRGAGKSRDYSKPKAPLLE